MEPKEFRTHSSVCISFDCRQMCCGEARQKPPIQCHQTRNKFNVQQRNQRSGTNPVNDNYRFAFKRIDTTGAGGESMAETVMDKPSEIGSDNETGPPLPPRPMNRPRFSLSMETGEPQMVFVISTAETAHGQLVSAADSAKMNNLLSILIPGPECANSK